MLCNCENGRKYDRGKNTIMTPNNIDRAHKHDVERMKPDTEEQIPYDSIYRRYSRKEKKQSMGSDIRMVAISEEEEGTPSPGPLGTMARFFFLPGGGYWDAFPPG